MPSGTTVNLKLLIQATNKASKTVESLRDQLNSVSKAAEDLAKKSSKAGKTGTDAMKAFEKSTAPLKAKLDKVTTSLEGIGTAGLWLLGIAGTLATVAFFPVKSATDFEHEMSKVVAVTEGAREQFAELKNTASELGRTTKFTAQQAASGMVFLGMAGMNAQEVIEGIGPALKLATAAGIELSEAADIATNIVAAMRLEVSDLSDAIDVLANTTANSNTNMLQLADAMKYAGPLAAAAHVRLEEVASIMGVLGNNGIQASMAGTAVRGMLRAIAAPTANAKRVLDELNVSIETEADGSIDLIKVLHDLAKAQMTTAQANAIFGRFAAAGTLAVTSHIEALDELIVSNDNAAGAATRMAEIMEANVEGAFIRLTSALDGLKRAFGDPLLGPIKTVIDTLTSLVTTITNLVEKFPVLTSAMGVLTGIAIAVTASLGALAITVASLGFATKQLSKIIEIELVKSLGVLILKFRATAISAGLLTASLKALRVVIFTVAEALQALVLVLAEIPIITAMLAIGAFLIGLKEWSNRNKRLIDDNKKLSAEMMGLYNNLERTKNKMAQLEVGSDKYKSTTKALREELLHVAETQAELRDEAEAAAASINELTGNIVDGGAALEKYNEKIKELAFAAMEKQIAGVEEEIRRLSGTSEQFGRVWVKLGMAASVTWGLITGGLAGAKKAAKEYSDELIRQQRVLESLNASFVTMLQTMGKLDQNITESELIVFLQTALGKGADEAKRAAEAFFEMQGRIQDAKDRVRELKDVKIDELNVKIKVATGEVKKLQGEYDTAVEKTKEAIAEWNALSEAEQKGATDLAARIKAAFDERTKASIKLADKQKETEDYLSDLLKKRSAADKKFYDESLKKAQKDKDLKVKEEWQYNIAKEKADQSYEVQRLKTLGEIQDQIKAAGIEESKLAEQVASEIIKQQERVKKAKADVDDAYLKHQRETADYIIQLNQEVEKQRVAALQEGPEKIRAQADLEIKVLEDKARKIGVAHSQLEDRIKQIKEKASRDIENYEDDVRYRREDKDIEAARRTADATVAEYQRAYEQRKISGEEYVKKSTQAITQAIDQEIALLEYRLEELRQRYGPDSPIVIDVEARIQEKKEEKATVEGEAPDKTREAELQDLRNYYAEKDTLLQAERDSMTENLNNAEEIAQKEKEILENKNRDILAAMEQAHIDKSIRERVANELSLQEKKVFADKEKAIDEMRYQWAADRAGQLSDIFGSMYELGGRKQKAWFIAQKAAAIAQVIMSTQVAAMKVMEEGWVGMVHKALIYAQGAMSIAKIASQSYAEGGEVKGRSPHKKADNIPARLTAGEWVMPVDAVQTYGRNVMEAMRKKLLPPEIFMGYRIPAPAYAFAGKKGYASGGEVKPQGTGRTAGDVVVAPAPPVNIVNVVDAGEMDRYLGSSAGQNAILNVLSSRSETVRRVLK